MTYFKDTWSLKNNSILLRLPQERSLCLVPGNGSAIGRPLDATIVGWQYLMGTCALIGTVANLLLLLILARFPSLRKGAGVLIIHLLLSHLILCGLANPLSVYLVHQTPMRMGAPLCELCRYYHFIFALFTNCVNWTDALLGLNRLVAVCFPMHYQAFNRPAVQCLTLGFCWVNNLAISLPPAFGLLADYRMGPLGMCVLMYNNLFGNILLFFNMFCPFAMTLVTTVVIGGRYATHLWQSSRAVVAPIPSALSPPPAKADVGTSVSSNRRKRLSRMLMASLVLSMTCLFPLYIVTLTNWVAQQPKAALYFRFLSTIPLTATPILFLAMNKDYQSRLLQLIPAACKPYTDRQPPGMSTRAARSHMYPDVTSQLHSLRRLNNS